MVRQNETQRERAQKGMRGSLFMALRIGFDVLQHLVSSLLLVFVRCFRTKRYRGPKASIRRVSRFWVSQNMTTTPLSRFLDIRSLFLKNVKWCLAQAEPCVPPRI